MRDRHFMQKDEWYKDRSELREGASAVTQHKSNRGVLKDYSLKHRVSIEYDLNEDSVRDRMFLLKIDDYTVLIDYEEFLRIGRFI